MADNFFKVKNGLNLPTLSADPTVTPPANSAAGDMAFYNGKLYIHNGTAWGIKPGSGSTGLIVNADVDAAAAIAGTKVDPNFGNQTVQTTGLVSAATLRASTKLEVLATQANEAVYIQQLGAGNALVIEDSANPDTTAFVVDASGNLGLGVAANATLTEKLTVSGDVKVSTGDIKLDTAKGIESNSAASTLNIGTGTNTQTLNLGTGSGTQTVNIGTGAGTTTINIGATGDSVVIAGTLTTVNTTNLDVADKNITLNKGGIAGSANGSGISIEAGGSSVASISFDQTDGGSQPQNTFSLSGTGSLALPSGTTAQRPNTPSNGMIRYNSTNAAFEGYASNAWSAIGGGSAVIRVSKNGHGFVTADVGCPVYLNASGDYVKAQADTAAKAEVAGLINRYIDANTFEVCIGGEVSSVGANAGGPLTPGEQYFLSATTAGLLTISEPTVVGQISKPVGIARTSTAIDFFNMRGSVVGGANVRTQIGLANNATTTVQNAGSYDAGSIEGWVYLDATTDYRFHVRANFAKNGLNNDYNLSYQTTGDTPPVGFSVGITAAGLIQVTLPNLAGFVAGGSFINFALNAPAVGATLPLQVDSANVSFTNIQAASSAGIAFKEDGGNTTMTITDAGNVGVGVATPASYYLPNLVVNSAGNTGISIIGGASSIGALSFGKGTGVNVGDSSNRGKIWYDFSGDSLNFSTGGSLLSPHMRLDASGNLLPGADNSYSLGNSSRRWSAVWAAIGTIQTSDEREKTEIVDSPLGLDFIKNLRPVAYKFKVGGNVVSTDEDGNGVMTPVPGKRQHFGLLAQQVKQTLGETDFGGWIQTDISNPESEQGLRYDEFISPLIKAIQEQQAQIEEMKAKLAALEAK